MFKTGLTAALYLLAATAAIGQQPMAVFEFQSTGVDDATAHTFMSLIRDRLGDVGGFRVIIPGPEDSTRTVDDAVASARTLGAEKAVIGTITVLGSRFIISFKLVDVAAAAIEFGDRATVGSTDELDIATERIARAIRDKTPFAGTGEVGTVTAAERSRSSVLSAAFLSTGYTLLADAPANINPGTMLFTLEAAISYETPDLLTLGQMGMRRGKNDYLEIYFDILIHKLFSRTDVSPFLGGGVGVHRFWGNGGADEDHGPAFLVSGGVILFRTQYFRITGGARASLALTEESGVLPAVGFHFGLTSPTFGPGSGCGGLDVPSPCIYGCMGAFFLVGLLVTLMA